jgi:EPS-associated MarR family transcriptional regulator
VNDHGPDSNVRDRTVASRRDDVRFKLLRLIERNPECSQRDLADMLGISLGGLSYCLRALIDKGQVKVDNFRRSPRKLRYAYVLTPAGMAERARLAGGFLKRKMQEYEATRIEIETLLAEDAARQAASIGSE